MRSQMSWVAGEAELPEPREKRGRIQADVGDDLARQVKATAALEGWTISQYVQAALLHFRAHRESEGRAA